MYSKELEITLDLNKKDIATNVLVTTGGTYDHNKLENRDIENQHPISAITGLSETLEAKQDKGDYALKSDIPDTTNLATKTELQNGLNNKQDKGNYALKSEIPTNNNQLANGAGYITSDYHDSTKQDVINDLNAIRQGAELGSTALQSIPDEYVTETELNAKGYLTSYTETDPVYKADKPNLALKSEIPTKVSSLTNDANYQTATDVASMIASIPQFEVKIVDTLPSQGQKMVLYLIPKASASGDNIYDEYVWLEGTSSFELVGSTTVDLSDYYSKTETDNLLDNKQDALTAGTGITISNNKISNAFTSLDNYTTFSNETLNLDHSFVYKSPLGDYKRGNFRNFVNNIIDPTFAKKSGIPTKTSQLTNDSGFVTQDSLLEKTSETWTFTLEDGTEVTKTMVLGA